MSREFDIEKVRKDFPFFREHTLAYLDNSATSQKPVQVMNAVEEFYRIYNSNPFRGLYDISEQATEAYENARAKVAAFIGAPSADNIIFTRNASESFNLLSYSLCPMILKEGDEIIIGITEHHSNMLPWRAAAERAGAAVKYLLCEPDGEIKPEKLEALICDKTKLVAITQVSNVFGRLNDIRAFADICHRNGAVLVADGAQSVPHMKVDVTGLDCDFLGFSGHKMLGPMGIGVLYGKKEYLEKMPPFMSGGEMIEYVKTDSVKYAPVPHKFEAGTVNAGGAVGLAAAIDYINAIGMDIIEAREKTLTGYAFDKMLSVDGVHIIGSNDPDDHHGILTFELEGVHPHDVAYILSSDDIAVRAGHHCAQPLLAHIGKSSTTRVSLAFYNTEEEIDRFAASLATIRGRMGF